MVANREAGDRLQRPKMTPTPKAPPATVVTLSGVEPQEVSWLWNQYIPLGSLTVFDGDPGVGKGLVSLDLAARVSTGRSMPMEPESVHAEPAGVILLTVEDSLPQTIVPRLVAAKADRTQIHALQGIRRKDGKDGLPTLQDVERIEQVAVDYKAKLVIIDPLSAYFGKGVDSHNDASVRSVLAPLADMADRRGIAVVLIRHLRKQEGSAINKGGGSIAIGAAARAVYMVGKDPENPDSRVMACTKNNLAPEPPSLTYEMRVGHSNGVAYVHWTGESDRTADGLLTKPQGRPPGKRKQAEELLLEILADGQRVPAFEVLTRAEEAGISKKTLNRAKNEVGAVSKQESDGWYWSIPEADGQ